MVSFLGMNNNNMKSVLIFFFFLEHSFLYEEKSVKSLSNILNVENTCGYITCVTIPTKYEKKCNFEQSTIKG